MTRAEEYFDEHLALPSCRFSDSFPAFCEQTVFVVPWALRPSDRRSASERNFASLPMAEVLTLRIPGGGKEGGRSHCMVGTKQYEVKENFMRK